MHVLFVTSEVAGVYKIGGLADVSYALPKALVEEGISVTVVLPYYKACTFSKNPEHIGSLSVDFGQVREMVEIFETSLPKSRVRLLLINHESFDEYHSQFIVRNFAFYSKSVASLYNARERFFKEPIDVVHGHDWHTAVIPLLIGERKKLPGASKRDKSDFISTMITIHNLMYQGVAQDSYIDLLNAPRDEFHIMKSDRGNTISLLREGIEHADMVTTVSETYAKEISARYHTDAIGRSIQSRKSSFIGILNGIDTDIWDPSTDSVIPSTYTSSSKKIKQKSIKKSLGKLFSLSTDNTFTIGFVGRIEPHQKGIDLVLASGKFFADIKNIRLVILGTGEKNTVEELSALSNKFPQTISFINAFDDKIAHTMYAGCDAMLVPSKFEPCGLVQLIAMRYGCIPIVRKTGGLADTVADNVTGFVFEEYDAKALQHAINRAYSCWADNQKQWDAMVSRAMQMDFSWSRSAKRYIEIYTSIQGKRSKI